MAERKIGQLLMATKRAKGTKNQLIGRGVIGGNTCEPPISSPPTLADLGLGKQESRNCQDLAKLDRLPDVTGPLATTAVTQRNHRGAGSNPQGHVKPYPSLA